MAGKVYDHHGRLLVRGGVTGTHRGGWSGNIEDGEFFAIQTGNGKPVSVVRFGTPPPPTIALRETGATSPSDFSLFARERGNFVVIGAAMDAGHLAAPDALPDGKGTLTGYVKLDNVYSYSGYSGIHRKIAGVGSLTIDADFGAGTVATTASQFVQDFDGRGFSGTLRGRGTIDRTTINSTLDGTLKAFSGIYSDYDADLAGKVYDDNGTLLVHGALTGTVESRYFAPGSRGSVVSDIEGGEFYAVSSTNDDGPSASGAESPSVSSFTLKSRLHRNAFAVGKDTVISEGGFRRLNRDLSSIDAAVAAGSLEAPD
ncbi:MAG: hypothetical protein GDA49_01195, partial [Rhodospirillales bacterium]|nr:hypothetical protein [Rhodospirillales bacterium]